MKKPAKPMSSFRKSLRSLTERSLKKGQNMTTNNSTTKLQQTESRVPQRNKILIVDDVELNRAILSETFSDSYTILEAENGIEALKLVEANKEDLAAILLDLIMPELDGMGVLEELNRQDLIMRIPVFLITAENSWDVLQHAYDLGVKDIIEKPFVSYFIKRRITNMLRLDNILKTQDIVISEQVRQIERLNHSLIEALATATEFRDCESGEHIKRMQQLTLLLCRYASREFPEFGLEEKELPLIAEAAVMHDIGKIAIPDSILNKPGRLTPEEFAEMKKHTIKGCELLETIPYLDETEMYHYAYDICRWHHERCDGKGYPDGLKGDEIPVWAQVVSLADVYDALVSPRVYKAAYSHEKAREMILNGECGTFSPKILQCLKACGDAMEALYQEES